MKNVDYTFEDTWNRRSNNLNNMTYEEYLKSEHWQKVKRKAKRRLNYQKCEFCESKNVELHHITYKWILTPFELRGIISLCRKHHQDVHDLAKEKNISVRLATTELRRIYKPDFFKPNR